VIFNDRPSRVGSVVFTKSNTGTIDGEEEADEVTNEVVVIVEDKERVVTSEEVDSTIDEEESLEDDTS
jgi:hypothetical protein